MAVTLVTSRIGTADPLGLREKTAPVALPDTGSVYTKDVGGITELFYIEDSAAGGTEIQMTSNGGINPGALDHGGLLGLGDDDHTQYARLGGRGTNQKLIGGLVGGNTLQLQANGAQGTGIITVNSQNTTIAAGLIVGDFAHTFGTPQVLKLTGGIHTGMTASTEVTGVEFNLSQTKTWAAGNIADQREVRILAPTYAFSAPSNITGTVALLYLEKPPVAGANATFDNTALTLWIDDGGSRFDGTIIVNQNLQHFLTPGDANPAVEIGSGYVLLGAGGATALDARFQRPSVKKVLLDDNASGAAILAVEGILRGEGTSGTDVAGLELDDGVTLAVSASDEGRIRYNATAQRFEKSENGGAYAALSGAGVSSISDPVAVLADISSAPPEVSIDEINTFELSDGATKGVTVALPVPRSMDLTVNPVVRFQGGITAPGAGNANVRFSLTARYVAVGEQIDKAADETILQTEAVVDVADERHEFDFTLDASLMAAADEIYLHLERLGTDAADTYTGAVGILRSARFDYDVA